MKLPKSFRPKNVEDKVKEIMDSPKFNTKSVSYKDGIPTRFSFADYLEDLPEAHRIMFKVQELVEKTPIFSEGTTKRYIYLGNDGNGYFYDLAEMDNRCVNMIDVKEYRL